MNPEDIKRYFEKNPPPPEVAWKPYARVTDSKKFLESSYQTLAMFKGNIETCSAWWHLKEFYLNMVKLNRDAHENNNNAPSE